MCMNTQNHSVHVAEPGISSFAGPIQPQIVGQATTPKKVVRHQSFPVTSTSTRDSSASQGNGLKQRPPHRSSKSDTPQTDINTGLPRPGTLLTVNATPSRAAAEFKSILGDHNARLKPEAALLRVYSGSAAFERHVTLEQAKPRARIEVDIFPQSNVYVQGDHLRGHIVIDARPATNKESPIFIVEGKIRVIGFESLGDKSRSIFYQCSATMSSIVPNFATIYAPGQDEEGFPRVKDGNYRFPFSLYLSLETQNGQARGSLRDIPGISLKYILMASIKIRDGHGRPSIAHFYRNIEVWPRFDPAAVLSPALRPLQVTVCKTPSKRSNGGRIKLTALLHRLYWVSGQSCRTQIIVENNTKRTLKTIALSLHQTTTLYPQSISGKPEMGPNSRHSMVSSKRIAESILEVAQQKTKGHASAKGWWLGVGPGQKSEFEHSILIPLDTLTVPRGQLFEVSHQIHVELSGPHVGEGTQVMLPIRIIGFLSVDPLVSKTLAFHLQKSRSPFSGPVAESTTDTCVCFLDRLSSLSHPKHHDNGKKAQQAERSNHTLPTLESPSQHLLCDPNKFPVRSTPEVLELGNVSLSGDTNDLVQQNARTAISKMARTGFFDRNRLSKEYAETVCVSKEDDISDSDSVGSVLQSLMEEIATFPSDEVETSIPQKLSSSKHSRFATRVQEKTRLATAAYLNGTQNDGFIQEYQQDPTLLQATFISGKTPLTLEIPPVSGVGDILAHSHQYKVESSNTSDAKTNEEQLEILGESNSGVSFDVMTAGLHSSSSGTIPQPQQVCPRTFMLGAGRNSCEHLPCVHLETPTKAKKVGLQKSTTTGATSTVSHVSAILIGSVSVKDKIRKLEEQVRAAALV